MTDQDHDSRRPVTVSDLAALTARLESMHAFAIERIKEVRADVAGSAELHDMTSTEVLGNSDSGIGGFSA